MANIEPNQSVALSVADPSIYRSPPYWHDDGDIILSVKDHDQEHRFQIHRIFLRVRSPVFRDMLAIGTQEKSGEVPIVPLQDDTVQDVKALLSAIYTGFEMYDTTSLDEVLGILRLGHKYQMEGLYSSAVKLLKRSWPLNRTAHLQIMGLISPLEDARKIRLLKCVRLIDVARLTGTSVLLPSAFYELAASNCGEWIDRIEGAPLMAIDDRQRIALGRRRWKERALALQEGPRFSDKATIWESARPLDQQTSLFALRKNMPGCAIGTVYVGGIRICFPIAATVTPTLMSEIGKSLLGGISIPETCRMINVLTVAPAVCEPCRKWVEAIIRNKETEIWENIPNDFDLPKIDEKEYTEPVSLQVRIL